MSMHIGGMIMATESLSTWRNTRSSAILSTTNPTWSGLRLKLGLCGERPAMNYVSSGMAKSDNFGYFMLI
jgi:hypothetical protein